MKKTVSVAQAATASEAVLPARVQEALGELVGAAREGLLALSVGVGLSVLSELMEEEVVDVVGPKGKQDPDRVAVRHGHEAGEVTLGGRRVAIERPRVRGADGRSELSLQTYAHFAERDPLTAVVLERMLAGVSTRRYRRTQEPVGSELEQAARSTSKSSVSRAFVERTRQALGELMGRRLDDVRLLVARVPAGAARSLRSLPKDHEALGARGIRQSPRERRTARETLAYANMCSSPAQCVSRLAYGSLYVSSRSR